MSARRFEVRPAAASGDDARGKHMRAMHWIVPIGLALALAACGKDEPAATPTTGAGESEGANGNDEAGKPPALAKGLRSPEALAVDALVGASMVRVLRLEPGTAAARQDCRTGRCIEGNLIESGLLLRDQDDAGNAASVVRAWLLESDMVEGDCDPAYHQALVFNASGREWALLMDRDCGAYQLVVDGRRAAAGFVEVPDEDPVAQALLGAEVGVDGMEGDAEIDGAGENAPVDDVGEDEDEGEGDGEGGEIPADATTVA